MTTVSIGGRKNNGEIALTDSRQQIIDRTMKLYVAALSDAADEIGLNSVCMDRGIVPLTKKKRMAGFARTGKLLQSSL